MANTQAWIVYVVLSDELSKKDNEHVKLLGVFDEYHDALLCETDARWEAKDAYNYIEDVPQKEHGWAYDEGIVLHTRIYPLSLFGDPKGKAKNKKYADIYIRCVTLGKDIYNLKRNREWS